jgi:hypothetical protein
LQLSNQGPDPAIRPFRLDQRALLASEGSAAGRSCAISSRRAAHEGFARRPREAQNLRESGGGTRENAALGPVWPLQLATPR